MCISILLEIRQSPRWIWNISDKDWSLQCKLRALGFPPIYNVMKRIGCTSTRPLAWIFIYYLFVVFETYWLINDYITNAYFIVMIKFLNIKKKNSSFQRGYYKNVSIIKANILCYFVNLMDKVEKHVYMYVFNSN